MIEFFETTLLGNMLSMLIVWCLVVLRVKLAKRHHSKSIYPETIEIIARQNYKAMI